jgi:uncharacterized damage-inducible protein DinB
MDPRYPIGRFEWDRGRPPLTGAERGRLIEQIAAAPSRLREAVSGLSPEQLDTPYRPEGWTVRQVAHHVPDSHINAYVRFKWSLTETDPAIKIYEESEWAKLEDSKTTPVEVSLELLEALHRRWIVLLRSLEDRDFARTLRHPESGPMNLDHLLAMYAWHGRHHVAHITSLSERMGWTR